MMSPKKTRFVLSVALGTALLGASMLSACGKLGDLEQAPPMMNKKAASEWSTSHNPDGGVTTTTDSSTSRASEKALPDADKKVLEQRYDDGEIEEDEYRDLLRKLEGC